MINNKKTIRFVLGSFLVVVLAIAIPLTTSCTAEPSAKTSEPINVGALLDATGAINIYGKPMIDATRLAVDHINDNGGVLGRQLNLIMPDCQSEPDLYRRYATEMIVENDVAVIIGGITSASREAIREPVIDAYETAYWYCEQYEGGVADKLVFVTGPTPCQQIEPLMPWAIEQYGPKFYTVAADYNYGWYSADFGELYGTQSGGELVGEEFVPLEVSDFTTTLANIQAADPDFILALTVGGNHLGFFRQWTAQGLKDKYPVVSPVYGVGNEQSYLGPDEHEGIIVALSYFEELTNPENVEFVNLFRSVYGDKDKYPYIIDGCANTWTAWHMWAEAVNQTGSLDIWDLIPVLEGMEYDAPQGTLEMSAKAHHLCHHIYLGEGNREGGYDIIHDFGIVRPSWEEATYDLVANPDLRTQFTP